MRIDRAVRKVKKELALEFDVTDFKSLLVGNVELKTYAETWVSSGWVISLEFDFLAGEPDYKYYQMVMLW